MDFLRSLGYTPIALPREHIQPLDLIGRLNGSGTARQLGPLPRLVVGDAEPPPIRRDEQVGAISGRTTDRLDVGTALRLAARFLAALGGIALTLEAAFRRARQVEFHYEDVRSDSVDILALRAYLGRRPPLDHTNPVVDDYFLGEGEVVVITRTLKSDAFGVVATDEHGVGVEIDVDLLRKELADAAIKATQGSRWKVTFRGARRLVFAFQGLRLRIDTGGLHVSDDIPPAMATAAVGLPLPPGPRPVVLARSGLLALD